MIDKHTIEILEFPKILSIIAGNCQTPFGGEEVAKIEPMFDPEAIETRLREISELKDIHNFGYTFPLFRFDDCREAISRSTVEGVFIEPEHMLKIADLVALGNELDKYDKEGREKFPTITHYLKQVRAFPELKKEIDRAIDERGEVKDSASSKLRQVRTEISSTRRKLMQTLEKILAGRTKQAGWQDDMVTMRNGRYVIPVPSSQYKTDAGILHDRSQSGATLFIEPAASVESNNKINILHQEERLEIDRILRAITNEIGLRAKPLLENCVLIGKLDAISACARLSNQIKGQAPIIRSDPSFDLIDARHPLLVKQSDDYESVIPNSVGLDDSTQVILVTGPNTGGKTVLLKTVGLSVLMAQSGLHIAAGDKSEVGIFEKLFADIGDEQSIELSLSTFSSHIRNIIIAINNADSKALLLFDEIGAGTDPQEGSALAEAIILEAVEKKARMIATTHYSQLKTLAQEKPEIENASLEFDRETLAPTYRIHLGIPGSSYAIEIAGRLGMPKEICEHANRMIGTGEKSLSALISALEAELSQMKIDKNELTERLHKAKQLEDLYRVKSDSLKSDVASEKKRLLDETEKFVNDTRKEIEHLVSEIRSSDASDESVKKFHRQLRERQDDLIKLKGRGNVELRDATRFEVGDKVRIITLNQNGDIDELIGEDKARVKIGSFTTTVELRNLEKLASAGKKPAKKAINKVKVQQVESPEIHLRGMTVEEAMDELEKFLDRAVISGLTQLYVIHGKGAGILRRQLTSYLKSHPEVDSLRLGNWNEGGAGVTIVKLKK